MENYFKRQERLSELRIKKNDMDITIRDLNMVDDEIKLIIHADLVFARAISDVFKDFVESNKDLYIGFNHYYLTELNSIEFRKKKDAFAVTGKQHGIYGYVSDPITYLIPTLLLNSPEEFKKERAKYVYNKSVENKKEDIEMLEEEKNNIEISIAESKKELEVLLNQKD